MIKSNSLSAAQGKALNDNKQAKLKVAYCTKTVKQTNGAYTHSISGHYRINVGAPDSSWSGYPSGTIVASIPLGIYGEGDTSFAYPLNGFNWWGVVGSLSNHVAKALVIYY